MREGGKEGRREGRREKEGGRDRQRETEIERQRERDTERDNEPKSLLRRRQSVNLENMQFCTWSSLYKNFLSQVTLKSAFLRAASRCGYPATLAMNGGRHQDLGVEESHELTAGKLHKASEQTTGIHVEVCQTPGLIPLLSCH